MVTQIDYRDLTRNWKHWLLPAIPTVIAMVFIMDPVGYWGLRWGAFLLCLLVGYPIIIKRVRHISINTIFFVVFVVVLPMWGLIRYSQHEMEWLRDTSYISFAILIGTSGFFIGDHKQKVARIATLLASLLIAFIIHSVLLYFLISEQRNVIDFLINSSVMLVGFRSYANIETPYIYVISSPILILGICLVIFSWKGSEIIRTALLLVFVSALFFSGTRAHQLLSVFLFGVFVYVKFGRIPIIIFVTTMLLFSVFIFPSALLDAIDPSEINNSHKLFMLGDYRELLAQPSVFWFGQGFNAYTWSSELRSMLSIDIGATRTELTFLEILRVFGVPLGGVAIAIIMAFVIWPRDKQHGMFWLQAGVFLQLVNAFFNPYLFSFNGAFGLAMLLGLAWGQEAYEVHRSPIE